MKVKEIIAALERFAPLSLQEDYDNAGLQVGLTETEVLGVLLCLDVTEAVIEEAVKSGANLIVAHHPLLFRPLKCVSDCDEAQRCTRLAVKHDIVIYAAHTNLDNARGGVNYKIAERLGLEVTDFLQPIDGDGGSGIIGTFGKAAASTGAFTATSATLKKFLTNKARSFIFSTESELFKIIFVYAINR